jgi:pyrroline-5-carboxylate reductase
MTPISAQSHRLAFVGGGNMTRAMIKGLLAHGTPASLMHVIDPSSAQRDFMTEHFGVSCSNIATGPSLAVDIIILAVKPQNMFEAVTAIAPWVNHQLIVSVAAGIRALDLSRWLGGYQRIVRAMPNTPSKIGWGATGIAGLVGGSKADLHMAQTLLNSVGITAQVKDEAQLDAVTALSGSGPAYVLRFLEALIEGGIALGLSAETAHSLALQTILGAAHMVQTAKDSPADLRRQVTSKGGTTAAALDVLEQGNLVPLVRDAMVAAARRSRELGDGFGDGSVL